MKSIAEYNFRDIVGKYVVLQFKFLVPGHEFFVAYCYIDNDENKDVEAYDAITLSVLGTYDNEEYERLISQRITLTYCNELMIELYDRELNPDMRKWKRQIDRAYKPSSILKELRDCTYIDPYRDKARPDWLNIPVITRFGSDVCEEKLPVKLLELTGESMVGMVIKEGYRISAYELVVICRVVDDSNRERVFGATKTYLDRIFKQGECDG